MNVSHTLAREPRPTEASNSKEVPRRPAERTRLRHWGGPVVGGFYLSMGGVHLGLVAADAETYRHFADRGLFPFVRDSWQNIFMTQPAAFGLLLMAGEMALGILLLLGGRFATVGWAGVFSFHLLLMFFGFAIWLWCIPALYAIVHLARKDTATKWAKSKPAVRCAE